MLMQRPLFEYLQSFLQHVHEEVGLLEQMEHVSTPAQC